MKLRPVTVVALLLFVLSVAVVSWNASAADPKSAAAGGGAATEVAALYNAKCAMCHGKDGVAKLPMGKGSANLNDPEWQKSTTVEAVAELISAGKGTMPAYKGKLTPEQIKAIAEYSLKLK